MTDEATATAPPVTSAGSGGGGNSPEIAAAEKAVSAIMTGVKNFGVFPPEHASTINMLQGVLRTLGQFWERYGSLAFEVEKHSLVYQGKAIYDGPAGDDNPAFVLHRAGISRFEFAPGLENRELVDFFLLYNHYRVEADEPDDDLVSALWRAGLSHIFYKASYELWSESETTVDYDALVAVDPMAGDAPEVSARPGKEWAALRLESGSDNYRKVSLAVFPGLQNYCTLTPADQDTLATMVAEEAAATGDDSGVRLMVLFLEQEDEASGLTAALAFLQEVYLDFLGKLAFQRALFVLEHVRKAVQVAKTAKPWALPVYKGFYAAILRPEIIANILDAWPRLGELGETEAKSFFALIRQFPPARIGGTIVALLPKINVPATQKLFVDLLLQQARNDRELLSAGLHSEVELLVLGMLELVKECNDRTLAEQHVVRLRYDSRSRVRQVAMQILASQNIY